MTRDIQIPPMPVPVFHGDLPAFVKETIRRRTIRAIQRGELAPKPEVCQDCGASRRLSVHHDNYRDPLAIRYLCDWCHHCADSATRNERELRTSVSIALSVAEKASFLGFLKTLGCSGRSILVAFVNSDEVRAAVRRYWLSQITDPDTADTAA
ncbi:MAG TPA: hypothetical protein VNL98_06715 [Gemmatimonadales bacterium]|nr:hypothetical protein [Gemmatimonadales bacterium]